MQITEMTRIKAAKRPQREWPKASTVGGPVVQVGNTPVLSVLIGNPISQSVMFFLPQPSYCHHERQYLVFSIRQNQLHAETFRLQIVYWLSPQGESANFFVFGVRDPDMLRVWMLLAVGAAAMRQVAEDVSAHSAVKGELEPWEEIEKEIEEALKIEVEKLAKKFQFPEKERLAEAVVKAFRNGEVDKADYLEEMDEEVKEKYLLPIMQRLSELPVAVSAIKFCSNLFREANSKAWKSVMAELEDYSMEPRDRRSRLWGNPMWVKPAKVAAQETEKAAAICHEVLTGELGSGGPKWAKEAAKSSQRNGR